MTIETYDKSNINEELLDVSSQYQERFGHGPSRLCKPVYGSFPLSSEQTLGLMKDALNKGEPVPTWAEAQKIRDQIAEHNFKVV